MDAPNTPPIENFALKEHAPTQNSLFSQEDLFIPDRVYQLRKSVSAIHSFPIPGSKPHTLNTRKLMDGCILTAQLDIKRRKDITIERIREERISPIFEVRLTDLAELSGIGAKHKQIYAVMEELFEKVFHWNILNEDASVVYNSKAHFLTMLGDGQTHKRGWVCFAMDPSILSLVLEPTTWATLSMEVLRSLSHTGAHALYQNTFRYLGTAKKVTAQFSVETWIDLLVGPSRYVKKNKDTGETTINYKDFKRYVLLPSIEIINSLQALNYSLELHERRSGTKVVALQFSFIKKQQASLDLPITWSEDIIGILRSIGFSDEEISNKGQSYSQVEIAETITRMAEAEKILKAKGVKISSRTKYFDGIMANVHKEFRPEIDATALSDVLNQQATEEEVSKRREIIETRFKEHQTTRYIENLHDLPAEERGKLFEQFEAAHVGNTTVDRFIKTGWKPENKPLMAIFRAWAKEAVPELELRLLPDPQDQSAEAWKDWRLANEL